ncbi:recombinase family protein [Falsihalocynthiibacter sp. SS001]|uniref:recombinase family protein n=1 Tax=Falsihalocynthiibacter sp. SS001 TaxID=3349698 RepID=UPI0036D274B1
MLVGYARTSTVDQLAGFEAQKLELQNVGCDQIFSEQLSSVVQRKCLEEALTYVRSGDTLVVTKLDRLARSTVDLLTIVSRLEEKEVALRILDFGGSEANTKSPSGKLMLTMFAAMAQFEREMMLERQREGIAKAKALGKYKGRAKTAMAKSEDVKTMRKDGISPSEIARRLSISRSSVYRIFETLNG